jgi:hypothetical protein
MSEMSGTRGSLLPTVLLRGHLFFLFPLFISCTYIKFSSKPNLSVIQLLYKPNNQQVRGIKHICPVPESQQLSNEEFLFSNHSCRSLYCLWWT